VLSSRKNHHSPPFLARSTCSRLCTQTTRNHHPTGTVHGYESSSTSTKGVRCASGVRWPTCTRRNPRTREWRESSPLATCSSRLWETSERRHIVSLSVVVILILVVVVTPRRRANKKPFQTKRYAPSASNPSIPPDAFVARTDFLFDGRPRRHVPGLTNIFCSRLQRSAGDSRRRAGQHRRRFDGRLDRTRASVSAVSLASTL